MNFPHFLTPSYPVHQELLGRLRIHRFATTHQLSRFTTHHYGSQRSALRQTLRHLQKLENRELVVRLERRIGGWQGGSSVSIWALSTSGYRMVAGTSRRQRPQAISTTFLGHLLAATEVSLVFTETIQGMDRWKVGIYQEPACWRDYVGAHGQVITLKPDLAVEITGPDFTDRYFVEVDRATENPARVVRKTRVYGDYLRSGVEQEKTGMFPAILWLVPTEKRRDQLRRYLSSEPDLPSDLWIVLTLEDLPHLVRDGPENYLGVAPPP